MHWILQAFILLLTLKLAAELILGVLDRRSVLAHASPMPSAFREVMDESTYQKSTAYTLAKNRFGAVVNTYDAAVLLLIILGGVLPWAFTGLQAWCGETLWAQALTLFAIGVLLSLPSLPFEWWSQFRLEERFGFNKSTLALWLSDKLKGLVLGFALGYPLLCLLLWFFQKAAQSWWLWAFGAVFVFQVLVLLLYPRLILPLFNKLTPLPEGELRDRLLALGERTGFKASTIQVMDGSKRSSHSNAFFTGFGRFRRIVLFDTLIDQLTPEELEAVLAHEIGHYKRGHVPKMLILSAVSLFMGLAVIAWLLNQQAFFTAFGFSADLGASRFVPALLLFSLLSGLITFWLTPFFNALSRKHEYEADAFARSAMGSPEPLIQSLRKMYEKNLGNLTPHPLFSAFYYSHPTLLERERALLKGKKA